MANTRLITASKSLPETFGAKLRRLATSAENNNPLLLPPWKTAPAYAQGEALKAGDVRASNGGWYVAATSTTTVGASGPTHLDGQAYFDGASSTGVLWLYIGPAPITADDAGAPSVSSSTSSPTGTYPNVWYPALFPGLFKLQGCYSSVYSTNYWELRSFYRTAGTFTCKYASVSFMTDAPGFVVSVLGQDQTYRVMVDGRYVQPSCFRPATSAELFITVDFASTSRRKARRVTIEMGRSGGASFRGIYTKGTDAVWAPPAQDEVRAVYIADSLIDGAAYGTFLPGFGASQRVAKLLGLSDMWSFSAGGTGWVNDVGGTLYTYGQRVPEALTRNPDLWLFEGSTNDFGAGATAITAAALAAFQAIRAGGSRAPIIVFGVWPLNDSALSATQKCAYIETAVQAAVTAFGDPDTYFIPVRNDPVMPWVTGSWNNTANANANNSSIMIAGDNTHPGEMGIEYWAARQARAIRTDVLAHMR